MECNGLLCPWLGIGVLSDRWTEEISVLLGTESLPSPHNFSPWGFMIMNQCWTAHALAQGL
jgi:hypothetical protein